MPRDYIRTTKPVNADYPQKLLDEMSRLGINIPSDKDDRPILRANVRIGKNTFLGKSIDLNEGSNIGANCQISNGCTIYKSKISDSVIIGTGSTIYSGCDIGHGAILGERVSFYGNVKIHAAVVIAADARISLEDIVIEKTQDCVVIGPVGRYNQSVTAYVSRGAIYIERGCFSGGIASFREKVKETFLGDSNQCFRDYQAIADYVQKRFADSVRSYASIPVHKKAKVSSKKI